MARLTAAEAAERMGITATVDSPTPDERAAPKTAPSTATATPPTPPAPAPEVTATAPPSSPSSETPTSAEPEETTPAWMKALESVDAKDLAKHPKVSGLIGDLAAKQAKKLAREAENERAVQAARDAEAAEVARIRVMEDADPYQAREERRRLEADKSAEAERVKSVVADYQQQALDLLENLSPEGQAKFAKKVYPGTAAQGFKAFLSDYQDTLTEERATERAAELSAAALQRERARWEKETREALRRELLAEANGNEPSVDVARGNGTSGAPQSWTDQQIRDMPAAEYLKNKDAIYASRLRRA